jgi:hypothetical protein
MSQENFTFGTMSSGTKKLPHDLGTPARGDLSWLPSVDIFELFAQLVNNKPT